MYSVRIAKAADEKKLARIHANTWSVPYSGQILDVRRVKRREAFWRGRLAQPRGPVFVIESDDIVGFCDLVPSGDKDADPNTISEIAAVYVVADHWRMGAGKVLCNHVLARARTQGYKAITLWILASNSEAMRFCESQRFARDGGFRIVKAPDGSNVQEIRYRIKFL